MYDKRAATKVIGTLIKHPELFNKKDKYRLKPSLFPDAIHEMVFKIVYNLYLNGVEALNQTEIKHYLSNYRDAFERFTKAEGDKFVVSAIELADKENFDYNYKRLVKFALLRRYSEEGFSVDGWHFSGLHNLAEQQLITERFDNAEPYEIIQDFQLRISEIESEFINTEHFKVAQAADGIDELIASLDKAPAVGLPGEGKMFNTITRGLRKTKLYCFSGQTGQGKTRIAVANACNLAYPIKWNLEKRAWDVMGSNQKIVFITTELTFDEIQTIVLAHLSGIPENKILEGGLSKEEHGRIEQAKNIMKHFQHNMILYHMPDPSIEQLKTSVRKLVLQHKADGLMMDYIHSSPALITEFSGARIREDVALGLMSGALKTLANELDIFVWTGTQLNRESNSAPFLSMFNLRGSGAIGDKLDVACAIRKPTEEMFEEISKITKQKKVKPTHCIDFFKNRSGQHNQVRLWLTVDLSTARFTEHFVTDEFGDLIPMPLLDIKSNAGDEFQSQINEIIGNKESKSKQATPYKITI